MRILLLVICFGSGIAAANSPNGHGVGHDHSSDSPVITVGQGNNDSSAYSEGSNADSDSASTVDTVVQIRREEAAITETVSSLNLSYCQTGMGAGDKDVSFNIGGLDYPCSVAAAVPQMLSAIAPLMKAAEGYPVGSEERNNTLKQGRNILNRVYAILGEDLPDYIENEGTFSLMWGITKNVIAPILLIILVI